MYKDGTTWCPKIRMGLPQSRKWVFGCEPHLNLWCASGIQRCSSLRHATKFWPSVSKEVNNKGKYYEEFIKKFFSLFKDEDALENLSTLIEEPQKEL